MELYNKTLEDVSGMIAKKKISSRELTEVIVHRNKELNPTNGAFITVCDDLAYEMAEKADALITKGMGGAITGVQVSVKDNICTAGMRTTCASRMLESYVPPYNATVVDKVYDECGIIVGKTNLDEFAMGAFGMDSALQKTLNPLDTDFAVGGSSSGAACAVASGMCFASIASDTGGSVRLPASFCGLCGFKPSYGAISRYGLVSYASSLDTVGIIAKNAVDASLLFSSVCGADKRDMTSSAIDDKSGCRNLSDVRFLFCEKDLENAELSIKNAFGKVIDILSESVVGMKSDSLFGNSDIDDAYKVIACAEATSNLARYDGIRFGASADSVEETRSLYFGDEVKRRILFGNYVLFEKNYERYYVNSEKVRRKTINRVDNIFKDADVIISPLCDFEVPRLGKTDNLRADKFTVAANFAGIPAISVPVGKDRNGMPISVQLMSKRKSDVFLLEVAKKLEHMISEAGELQ